MFGVAKTLGWLFIARGLSGVLSAAVLPTVMAYVADVTTEEKRGKGMGLMGAAMGLGFVLGPGIGGIMGDHNTPFFVAGGLSIFTLLTGIYFFQNRSSSQNMTNRPPNLLLIDWGTFSHAQERWFAPWLILNQATLNNPLT